MTFHLFFSVVCWSWNALSFFIILMTYTSCYIDNPVVLTNAPTNTLYTGSAHPTMAKIWQQTDNICCFAIKLSCDTFAPLLTSPLPLCKVDIASLPSLFRPVSRTAQFLEHTQQTSSSPRA